MGAAGTADGQTAGQRSAYEYALRCWAVAGYIASEPGVRRNVHASAQAEASARRAFDASVRMGTVLGYSGPQISEDLDSTARLEGALMLRDRSYFERTKAACQQLGLI
jgi:hypothetical protein